MARILLKLKLQLQVMSHSFRITIINLEFYLAEGLFKL